jgi:hypothetical protein
MEEEVKKENEASEPDGSKAGEELNKHPGNSRWHPRPNRFAKEAAGKNASPAAQTPEEQADQEKPSEGDESELKDGSSKKAAAREIDEKIDKYSDVDFSRFSKEKMFDVIYELLLELKRIRRELAKYDEENMDFYKKAEDSDAKVAEARKALEYTARKLSPTYALETLKGDHQETPSSALADLIVCDVLKERGESQKRISDLLEKSIQYKCVVKELTKQLEDAARNPAGTAKDEPGDDATAEEQSPSDFAAQGGADKETADALEKASEPKPAPADAVPAEVAGAAMPGARIAIVAVDLDRARNAIGETEAAVMKIIGSTGAGLYKDIEDSCTKQGITESKIKAAFIRLESNKILSTDIVQTVRIKRGIRVSELTKSVGEVLYREKFKSQPVQSQKSKLLAEYGNLSRGYSILEVKSILEEIGYTAVSIDQKSNRQPLGDNRYWVPDIVCVNTGTSEEEFFDVEVGEHSEAVETRLSKAALLAHTYRFVVISDLAREKLRGRINSWIASTKDRQVRVISICTSSELENRSYGIEIK